MMDRERREKRSQETFQRTWQSYRAAMEKAFALQEQTLDFARSLLEAPVEALRNQAESNRATLDELAEQSRKQQEALESLIRGSTNAYVNLLQAPFSYYQEIMEAMTAPWTSPRGSSEGRGEGDSLPLANYDSLNVREVSDRLDDLGTEEIKQLRDYEVRNKNRKTLVERLDARIEPGSS